MPSTELVLLIVYALLGPGVTLGLIVLARIGERKLNRFDAEPAEDLSEGEWPPVTIFVPVRNEAAGIADCVRRLLAQRYPAEQVQVVVANDRSTDGTGDILERLAAELDGRLRVIDIEDCPAGWLGKPHALHVAEHEVESRDGWYLFVDSDVLCEPDVLRRSVSLGERRSYDLISLLPRLIMPTWLERVVAPVAAAVWLTTFRATDTNNDNRPRRAIANGQFLLVRTVPFRATGGHAAVRDRTCEDVELARLVKGDGGRVRMFMGRDHAATRMHANWSQLFNGWARNFAGTARHRPLKLIVAVLFLLAGAAAPAFAAGFFVLGMAGWGWVATCHAGLAWAWTWNAYLAAGGGAGGSALAATLFPATLCSTATLVFNGIRACFGATVQWRGSAVKA